MFFLLSICFSNLAVGSQGPTIQQRAERFYKKWTDEEFSYIETSHDLYRGNGTKKILRYRLTSEIDNSFKAGILSYSAVFLELYADRTKKIEKHNELLAQLLARTSQQPAPVSSLQTSVQAPLASVAADNQTEKKAAKEPVKDGTK